MTYFIADIHGCFREYRQLLEKIGFSDRDELYVLGDALDRGPEPIRVLQDMMERPNVYFLLGNHDLTAYMVLRRLAVEITEEALERITAVDLELCSAWMEDGGEQTMRQFRRLSRSEQEDLLGYLEEASLYEEVFCGGVRYLLVHADLGGFSPEKLPGDYTPEELLFSRADYGRRYFPDAHTRLVTGHTPTALINDDGAPDVYQKNGHIAIDCGCVFGGRLAAFCAETGSVTYVDGPAAQAR